MRIPEERDAALQEARRMRQSETEKLQARLQRWAESNPELTLADLARFAGVSPSKARRLLGREVR